MKTLPDHKSAIRNNFSKYAHLYDEYASVQSLMASSLINYAPAEGVTKILEIGCGTGGYTRLLRERFKGASIKALDASQAMIETARKKIWDKDIEFILADAEEWNPEESFDLVTSNAALQWCVCFDRTAVKYKNALSEKGTVLFSIFGPMTFWELNQSLEKAIGRDLAISAANFLDKDDIEKVLAGHFGKISVKETIIAEHFLFLTELLNKIRCMGARGSALDNLFLWKRDMLKKTEDIYRRDFGGIEATYQIFFCKATT